MLNDYAHSRGREGDDAPRDIKFGAQLRTSSGRSYTLMNKYGYDAVKSGCVGIISPHGEYHYGQLMNNHYLYCLQQAAKHHIMVNA